MHKNYEKRKKSKIFLSLVISTSLILNCSFLGRNASAVDDQSGSTNGGEVSYERQVQTPKKPIEEKGVPEKFTEPQKAEDTTSERNVASYTDDSGNVVECATLKAACDGAMQSTNNSTVTLLDDASATDEVIIPVSEKIEVNQSLTVKPSDNVQKSFILQRQSNFTDSFFEVSDNATFTILTNSEEQQMILNGNFIEANAPLINANSSTRVVLGDSNSDITLCNNENSNGNGGALSVQEEANVSIMSTSIIDNTAKNGGGIYNEGVVECHGESLIGRNNAQNGGGVYINSSKENDTYFNMHDRAVISLNEAANDGGGVYNNVAETYNPNTTQQGFAFTAHDQSSIDNNKAGHDGGGAYYAKATSNMPSNAYSVEPSGQQMTEFKFNEAGNNGGGIYTNGYRQLGDFENFFGNSAKNGGGIYVSKTGRLDATGNVKIGDPDDNKANEASENGGGIYAEGTANLTQTVSVQYNEATNGGGVYVYRDIASQGSDNIGLHMQDFTEICDNSASENGGGIYTDVIGKNGFIIADFTAHKSSAIRNNKAGKDGGGAYFAQPNQNMPQDPHTQDTTDTDEISTFSGNTAEGNGGGIYASGYYLMGDYETIVGNSAKNGGGIYVSKTGRLDMTGNAKIGDPDNNANEASENGGGIYSEGVVNANKNVQIIYNHAINGGGAYLSGDVARLKMTGEAAIINNYASQNGGGVYNNVVEHYKADGSGFAFTCHQSVKITENTAAGNGGGAYFAQETQDIPEGYIYSQSTISENEKVEYSSNYAGENGGAIYTNGYRQFGDNESVKENEAKNGGGIYVSETGRLDATGNFIATNNKKAEQGTGVYNSGVINLTKNASIKNNVSNKDVYNYGALHLNNDSNVANVYLANDGMNNYCAICLESDYTSTQSITFDLDKSVLGGIIVANPNSVSIDQSKFVINTSIAQYVDIVKDNDSTLYANLKTEVSSNDMSMNYTGGEFKPEINNIKLTIFGGEQEISNDNLDLGDFEVKYFDETKNELDQVPTKVGTYYGKVTFIPSVSKIAKTSANLKYLEQSEVSDFFKVLINNSQMTVNVENFKGDYDGKTHSIKVNVTNPDKDFKIIYGTTEGVYNLSDAPQFSQVGNFKTYFKVTAYGYDDYMGSGTVEIVKTGNGGGDNGGGGNNDNPTVDTTSTLSSGSAKTGDNMLDVALPIAIAIILLESILVVTKKRKDR